LVKNRKQLYQEQLTAAADDGAEVGGSPPLATVIRLQTTFKSAVAHGDNLCVCNKHDSSCINLSARAAQLLVA
jgi:hypothetical protein